MHLMTSAVPARTYILRVDVENYMAVHSYAEYSYFVVDSEADNYELHLGVESGTNNSEQPFCHFA